jgi:hypothetical protein
MQLKVAAMKSDYQAYKEKYIKPLARVTKKTPALHYYA